MRSPKKQPHEQVLPKGGPDLGQGGDLARLEWAMDQAIVNPAAFPDGEALAKAAQVGVARLEDLFRDHAHQAPTAFLQRIRIQSACDQLVRGQTDLACLASEAGYANTQGFQRAFQQQTGLSPEAYRTMLGSDHFTLPLPIGLRVQDVLAFQGRDGQSVSERVEGARLQKAFLCEGQASLLSLTFGERAIAVTLAGVGGGRAMARAHGAALRLLGWHGDPSSFESAHPDLARGREGLRVLLTLDPFEALVWAILGQQVNLAFAYALRRDLIRLVGVPASEGLIAHPDATRIAALEVADLQALRLSRRKAEYLLHAAVEVAAGRLRLDEPTTATSAVRNLLALRGCGPWTAQYVLMRGLGFRDGVPVGDAGLTLALQRWFGLESRPDGPETLRLMTAFAPHRSLATFHLWASLKGTPA
jgi:AraC family transcriptional regulator, regulatory protein of adaptative response / DNA-3-methyladenine glycosylase II